MGYKLADRGFWGGKSALLWRTASSLTDNSQRTTLEARNGLQVAKFLALPIACYSQNESKVRRRLFRLDNPLLYLCLASRYSSSFYTH